MSDRATASAWAGASAIAISVHLVLVQQGLAAYTARNIVPDPVTMPDIEIMAVASSVAGATARDDAVATVPTETLSPVSDAGRVTAQAVKSAQVASATRTVSPAPSLRISATVKAAASPIQAAPKLPSVTQSAVRSLSASTVSPVRPNPLTAATVKSKLALSSQPRLLQPGVTPPAVASVAISVTAATSAAASPQPATAVATALAAPALTNKGAAQGPKSTAVSTTSAGTAETVVPVLSVNMARIPSTSVPLAAVAPVIAPALPSLPPPVEVLEREGIAAPQPDITPQTNLNTYQSVLDVLAQMPKTPCFAALPTLSESSVFQLEVFARTPEDIAGFADRLTAFHGQTPNSTMKAISVDQCAAAGFVTESSVYPRFKLFFDLPTREIKSGAFLDGRIGNTSGGFISLLLIDDEGLVQDLAGFLQFAAGKARFKIPMSLTGQPVVTQQLLMAISSPSFLQSVVSMNGTKADVFFPALATELREKGHTEDVALVAFSVQ